MRVSDALALKKGAKVFIDYSPNPGHGERIACAGTVSHVGTEVNRNTYDVEYVWVTVKYQGMESTFPSFCLVKL